MDVVHIDATQHKEKIFVTPDIAVKEQYKGKKWMDGCLYDTEYFLKSETEQRRDVIKEHGFQTNGSNFKCIAKGKAHSHERFQGDILFRINEAKNSGINCNGMLILDPADANFTIEMQNVRNI